MHFIVMQLVAFYFEVVSPIFTAVAFYFEVDGGISLQGSWILKFIVTRLVPCVLVNQRVGFYCGTGYYRDVAACILWFHRKLTFIVKWPVGFNC